MIPRCSIYNRWHMDLKWAPRRLKNTSKKNHESSKLLIFPRKNRRSLINAAWNKSWKTQVWTQRISKCSNIFKELQIFDFRGGVFAPRRCKRKMRYLKNYQKTRHLVICLRFPDFVQIMQDWFELLHSLVFHLVGFWKTGCRAGTIGWHFGSINTRWACLCVYLALNS